MNTAPKRADRRGGRSMVCRTLALLVATTALAFSSLGSGAAERLEEPATDNRTFRVECRLEVKGKLETALQGGKAQAHDMVVNAVLDYFERRVSGVGRDAQALRSLRSYDEAKVDVKIDDQKTSTRLPEALRTIVAQGDRGGIIHYALDGPLTAVDTELLRVSGDSLANLALLPAKPVEKGDTWSCEAWVPQMLTGTDAVLKSDLTCKVTSVDDGIAKVKFEGQLEGASSGASTKISLEGKYEFDLEHRYLRKFEMEEKEKRSLGTRPGYDVVASVRVERELQNESEPLTDELVGQVPLDAGESLMSLRLDLPWGARFLHDRDWHLFRQTQQAAVLRLLEKGSFIAQCNVAKAPDAEAGNHTPEEQFQADITKGLGEKLTEITKAEELNSEDGVYRYRVTAVGKVGEVSMTWFYYLCAAPNGKQTSYVFAVETSLLERLGNRDLDMVSSLEFANTSPTPANGDK